MPLILGRVGCVVPAFARIELEPLLLALSFVDRCIFVEENHPSYASIVVPLCTFIEASWRQRVVRCWLLASKGALAELVDAPDVVGAVSQGVDRAASRIDLVAHIETTTLLIAEEVELLTQAILLHLYALIHLLAEHHALAIVDELRAHACEADGAVVLLGVHADILALILATAT